jgi:ParB-like chromosome segregation protein Spo0J
MTKHWRDVLPVHPSASLLPMMGDDELNELVDDIKAHGLRQGVAVWEDEGGTWFLLDGRNRLEALERSGVRFEYHRMGISFPNGGTEVWNFPVDLDVDPYSYVLSANVRRRHLTPAQKREIVARLLKAQPQKSDRQIAKSVGVDHKTVGAQRAKQEGRGEIPHVEARTDTKGRQQPATKVIELKRSPPQRGAVEAEDAKAKTQRDSLTVEIRQLVKLLTQIKRDVAFITDADTKRLAEAQQLLTEIGAEYLKLRDVT